MNQTPEMAFHILNFHSTLTQGGLAHDCRFNMYQAHIQIQCNRISKPQSSNSEFVILPPTHCGLQMMRISPLHANPLQTSTQHRNKIFGISQIQCAANLICDSFSVDPEI
ncbi:hypothetical protein AVEN_185390-1 [Araneus ventricosus]|uniref:Uncharacterized protein n=1 Tax=Araneus ventricosus TaxID=182803 RepID=A0A4Y2CJG4_ARAVE|nr:hypothetical protein AVEN_185390-1 [Araneus ventricosus]